MSDSLIPTYPQVYRDSHSPEDTRRLGRSLGAHLQAGDVICLIGDLGAGKTTLVQGIAAGWGSSDQANSPTFVLVNVYRRSDGGRMAHLDTYRLSGPAEAEDLDLDALIERGPLLVEWADRIVSVLPQDHLWVELSDGDDEQRSLRFSARGPRSQALLQGLEL